MKLGNHTVLLTGGASGIGLALAARFLAAGDEVIICGRREAKLAEAKAKYPKLHTHVCDVADEKSRAALCAWATATYPELDVLVNNAGVQRRVTMTEDEAWSETAEEIAINFAAPIHLTRLFVPHLIKQRAPAIVNVTSGLSFVPLANVPVYSATKAALHSFTLSLRHQLKATRIEVIEIIPPAVDTDLQAPGLHTFGVPVDEFADSVMARLGKGELEIPYGTSAMAHAATPDEQRQIFNRLNAT